MTRPLTTLRTGVRTALLPINRTYRPFFSDTDASKGRAAQWEPSLQLDALLPAKQQQDDNNDQDGEDDVPWMTTYSAFDPAVYDRCSTAESVSQYQRPLYCLRLIYQLWKMHYPTLRRRRPPLLFRFHLNPGHTTSLHSSNLRLVLLSR